MHWAQLVCRLRCRYSCPTCVLIFGPRSLLSCISHPAQLTIASGTLSTLLCEDRRPANWTWRFSIDFYSFHMGSEFEYFQLSISQSCTSMGRGRSPDVPTVYWRDTSTGAWIDALRLWSNMVMFDDVAYPAYRLVQLNSMDMLGMLFFHLLWVYNYGLWYVHTLYIRNTHTHIHTYNIIMYLYTVYIYIILYVHFYTYMVLDTTPKGVIM